MPPSFDYDIAPAQDAAGKDFDKWFDWNSATNVTDITTNGHGLNNSVGRPIQFPISPSSTAHSDGYIPMEQSQSFTANPKLDIPTPSHTSSSPEARSSLDLRLSGDALREQSTSVTRPPLKRKFSPTDASATPIHHDEPTPTVKKRPHNIIEKRYRANLNEKIAELRDSVPSLRMLKRAKGKEGSNAESDDDNLDGITPSNKLNKASILTKAVEYIRHLEVRTNRLEIENRALKERLETLDRVIAQGGHDSQRATAFTSDKVIEEHGQSPVADASPPGSNVDGHPSRPIQGLIPISDSWRQLRQAQSQEHYGHVYSNSSTAPPFRGKWPTRIMLGSLAGLMVMEGFGEKESGSTSKEKGLFGIPLELLDGWKFLRSPRVYLSIFAQYCRSGGVIPLIKGFMTLTIVAFLVFAYLFNSKPPPKKDVEEHAVAPSLESTPASPIEVRRRAWSTSMQSLQLPHHHFFAEWLAVTLEWLHYSIRYCFGSKVYCWLTGRSAEDDMARISAWDVAIDAQLAGGDIEVSRSRVVLTSFGSGTLPRTPLRLMLKALHCRVLLWNVGQPTSPAFKLANATGKFFANREWKRARHLHEALSPRGVEPLPKYLAALLAMDCDEVFLDNVVQRAYNLMYDRPTQEGSEDLMLNVVVEDHAVKSPLDAIAAWRSTCALRSFIGTFIQCSDRLDGAQAQDQLGLALRIAPHGSAAETRCLAAYAVFGDQDRRSFYRRAYQALDQSLESKAKLSFRNETDVPYFVDSSIPRSARADVETCLRCAEVLFSLEQVPKARDAQFLFANASAGRVHKEGLGLAALQFTRSKLAILDNDNSIDPEYLRSNSKLDTNEVGIKWLPRLLSTDNLSVQNKKTKYSRRQSDVSYDTGYESQEDYYSNRPASV